MLLNIQKKKDPSWRSHHCAAPVHWTRTRSFVANSRGVLIHRPRYVATHKLGVDRPHLAVEYMCGQMSTGMKKFTFLDEPPEDGIVCERCETKAIEAGRLSSDSIAGRHVHIGGVKAVRTCCLEVEPHAE